MEEWKTYKLSDVCRFINGRAYSQDELLPQGKYQVLRVGNVGNDGHEWYYSDMELPNDKYCNYGDLLYTWACNFGPVIWTGKKAIYHYHIWKVEENPEIIDRHFLFYLLLCSTESFKQSTNGSVMIHITKKDMERQEVRVPSLEIQKQIASILDSLYNKIELNNRINHNLEEQAQALYKSWFIDFDPFRDGNFVDSELGMIPEGWRVGSIYEYAKVIYGAPYKSSLFNESGDGLPLIRIRDLKDCSPQFYSPEVLPNTEYVLKGDIVAGMDADFTPYIWKGSKGLLNQRVCKFVPISESISRYYIMMMVKPELEFVSSYKVGTTVSHLGKSDIDRFTVLIPPVEVIERYSRIVDSILEQIVTNSTEAAVLTEQRNTLLPQLMSGKINC